MFSFFEEYTDDSISPIERILMKCYFKGNAKLFAIFVNNTSIDCSRVCHTILVNQWKEDEFTFIIQKSIGRRMNDNKLL